ncbi:MAG: gfo/Idh/MocA family oxidoreductase, partial [Armatimonadetes bacterium CG07_land_8_20_14_0_80_59_28]
MNTRLSVLGFAHAHVSTYCSRWVGMDDVRLVAGWDHDTARGEKSCADFGMEFVADSDSLMRRDDVDAVVIGAETSMHADLAVAAAEAGKQIVVQKPMALTLEEADRIIEAVEEHHVPFTLAWQMRLDPQNLEIKRVIDADILGRIFMVRRRHGLATHLWPNFDQSWYVKSEYNHGMFADDAAHPIDFLHWLFGMPDSVTAEIDTLLNPNIPDDNGIAIFRYPDGMFAEVVCSFTFSAGENTTEIVGEKGVLIQNYGDGPSSVAPRPKNAIGLKWYLNEMGDWSYSDIPSPQSQGERIAGLARPLVEFVRGERPPICTAREGRDSLR